MFHLVQQLAVFPLEPHEKEVVGKSPRHLFFCPIPRGDQRRINNGGNPIETEKRARVRIGFLAAKLEENGEEGDEKEGEKKTSFEKHGEGTPVLSLRGALATKQSR